jgi:hypothetical protein
MVSKLLIKLLFVIVLHKIEVLRKSKQSSVMCHSGQPTTVVTEALLQRAYDLNQNNGQITTKNAATELSISNGSVKNITVSLGYSEVCARWVRSLTNYHKLCGKRFVHICSSITRLRVNAFCNRSSLGMKHGAITLNCIQKDNQWNGIIELLLGRRSLRLPLQQGKSWPLFLECKRGDFGRHAV